MSEKTCLKCGETKSLDAFYRDKSRNDGRSVYCSVCRKSWKQENAEQISAYNKQYQAEYRQKNRERLNAHDRARYAADPSRLERAREYQRIHRDERSKYLRSYYQQNKDRLTERMAAYYTQNAEALKKYARRAHLLAKYGLTEDQYLEMMVGQEGKCAICGLPSDKRHLTVDHCHTTGKIRSLLCGTCNTGLGSFKDSIDVLRRAIAYLEKHNSTD